MSSMLSFPPSNRKNDNFNLSRFSSSYNYLNRGLNYNTDKYARFFNNDDTSFNYLGLPSKGCSSLERNNNYNMNNYGYNYGNGNGNGNSNNHGYGHYRSHSYDYGYWDKYSKNDVGITSTKFKFKLLSNTDSIPSSNIRTHKRFKNHSESYLTYSKFIDYSRHDSKHNSINNLANFELEDSDLKAFKDAAANSLRENYLTSQQRLYALTTLESPPPRKKKPLLLSASDVLLSSDSKTNSCLNFKSNSNSNTISDPNLIFKSNEKNHILNINHSSPQSTKDKPIHSHDTFIPIESNDSKISINFKKNLNTNINSKNNTNTGKDIKPDIYTDVDANNENLFTDNSLSLEEEIIDLYTDDINEPSDLKDIFSNHSQNISPLKKQIDLKIVRKKSPTKNYSSRKLLPIPHLSSKSSDTNLSSQFTVDPTWKPISHQQSFSFLNRQRQYANQSQQVDALGDIVYDLPKIRKSPSIESISSVASFESFATCISYTSCVSCAATILPFSSPGLASSCSTFSSPSISSSCFSPSFSSPACSPPPFSSPSRSSPSPSLFTSKTPAPTTFSASPLKFVDNSNSNSHSDNTFNTGSPIKNSRSLSIRKRKCSIGYESFCKPLIWSRPLTLDKLPTEILELICDSLSFQALRILIRVNSRISKIAIKYLYAHPQFFTSYRFAQFVTIVTHSPQLASHVKILDLTSITIGETASVSQISKLNISNNSANTNTSTNNDVNADSNINNNSQGLTNNTSNSRLSSIYSSLVSSPRLSPVTSSSNSSASMVILPEGSSSSSPSPSNEISLAGWRDWKYRTDPTVFRGNIINRHQDNLHSIPSSNKYKIKSCLLIDGPDITSRRPKNLSLNTSSSAQSSLKNSPHSAFLEEPKHPLKSPMFAKFGNIRDIPVGGIIHLLKACINLVEVNLSGISLAADYYVMPGCKNNDYDVKYVPTTFTRLLFVSDVPRMHQWRENEIKVVSNSEIIFALANLQHLKTIKLQKLLWMTEDLLRVLIWESKGDIHEIDVEGGGMTKGKEWAINSKIDVFKKILPQKKIMNKN